MGSQGRGKSGHAAFMASRSWMDGKTDSIVLNQSRFKPFYTYHITNKFIIQSKSDLETSRSSPVPSSVSSQKNHKRAKEQWYFPASLLSMAAEKQSRILSLLIKHAEPHLSTSRA